MKRIAVVGATGRTGRHVLQAVLDREDVVLHAAIVSQGSTKIGERVATTEVRYGASLADIEGADVVIDFTTPEVSIEVARLSQSARLPLLVGTTGHSSDQRVELESIGKRIPLACVSNTSLGATTVSLLAREAQRLLGPDFDIELVEMHHNRKKDAPSGTALMITEQLDMERPPVVNRTAERRKGEVGIVSVRGGDVVGDHTVYFLGAGERVEIVHRVSSRATFGVGAVSMSLKLSELPIGMYGARDLLV